MSDTPRPRQHLIAAGKLYPGAWRQVDHYRQERGRGYPAWPDWCYIPIAVGAGIVAEDAGVSITDFPFRYPERIQDCARLTAIATWRVTQGIYRFDPALYADLIETPINGDIPCEVLHRLPEWCVYVETPDLTWLGAPLYGAWAHLEWDPSGRQELRLLLDGEADLTPVPLHLGAWTLDQALDRAEAAARHQAGLAGFGSIAAAMPAGTMREGFRSTIAPVLSMLLYLCTEAAEIGTGERRPENPAPKRTKQGWRMFPADGPTTWDVGVRLGAALRRAYHAAETAQGGTHSGPRGHIRRAHWHGYWVGPRAEPEARKFDLRWMPPIPVNLDSPDGLPSTIRPVGGAG